MKMGCIQLPDLDDGRSSRRIRFADVSARMTSTVVSNTLTRSLLINPSSDVKPPLNCVMLRNVMRCRSDGRPSAIVYISLYPRSKHEAQANGHDYVDVDAMAVDEKRRRVDPSYRKVSNCLYADSLRLGLVNVTYLGSSFESDIAVYYNTTPVSLRVDSLSKYCHRMSRFVEDVDAEWDKMARCLHDTILGCVPSGVDLSVLEAGDDLFARADELPLLGAASEAKPEAASTAPTPTEPADLENLRLKTEALKQLMPSGLNELVAEAREISPVSTLEHRDELVAELEKLVSNLKALDGRAEREADLIGRLRTANRTLETIVADHHVD